MSEITKCVLCGYESKWYAIFSRIWIFRDAYKNIKYCFCMNCYKKAFNKAKGNEEKIDAILLKNFGYNTKEEFDEDMQREKEIKEIMKFDLGLYGIAVDAFDEFPDNKRGSKLKFSINNIKKRLKNKEITEENIDDAIEHERELAKIEKREKKYKIIGEVEKEVYGEVKTKRKPMLKDKQEHILNKFNNKGVICGRTEGLHIHHKNKDSKNNQISNLIVLCGVCHKKIHMKVR